MQYEIVTLEEATVAGIAARTANHDPDMGMIIGSLWNRFFGEGTYTSIPGKTDQKALGIYTDYTNTEKGEYTVLTACRVQHVPEDAHLTVKTIPAGKYARFIVRGHMHQAVAQAWQEIWQTDLPRAFTCDFEEYQDGNMEQAEIHIYISLK